MQNFDASHDEHAKEKRKSASIVVYDSNPLSLITIAGVLDYQGYGVICARAGKAALEAFEMGPQDLIIIDVGDDPSLPMADLDTMRAKPGYEELPAILIADSFWAGLEKKAEAMKAPTRCLFQPIDPNSLIAVVHHVLYMPTLVKAHRKRGTRPSRPGWISL